MRDSTAGEQTTLAATYRVTHYRVDIADPDGVMVDVSDLASYGWLVGVDLDEHIDQSVAAMTVILRREVDISGGTSSLSPYRTDSPANPDGAAIDVYRAVKYYEATVTGARPAAASTDWKLKFDGVTDRVSMPNRNEIIVSCRDKGAHLVDQWVRDSGANIAGNGGRPLPDVINDLLRYAPIDDVVQTVTVNGTWDSPGYVVTSFPLKHEPAMTAIQRAAQLAVADFRFAWNATSSSYVPTLTIPDRDSPTSVATFGDADIVAWHHVDRDRLGVRNHIILSYRPKDASFRRTASDEDATSIQSFGRRVLTISEADDSSIDTADEAEDMLALILADVKDPKVDAECEMLPDWRIELNDYLTFSGNKYFDVAQSLAVIGIRRQMRPNSQRMILSLRGNPSAGYQRWIERAKQLDEDNPTPADNGLTEIQHTDDDTAGTRTITWTRGTNVAFVAFYEALATAPISSSAFPDAGAVAGMVAAGASGASILSRDQDTWVASRPPRGKQRFGIAVPYFKLGGRVVQGDALKMIVDPLPSNMSATLFEDTGTSTETETDLILWVTGSASDWPITVEVWQGEESGAADYSYTVNANTIDADAVTLNLKDLEIPYQQHRTWSLKASNVAGETFRSAYTERRAILGAVGQGTLSIDANGAWGWEEDGIEQQGSVKYAESTSGFPSDATAIAGTTINGQNVVRTGGAPLSFGQTMYVTIVPYTEAGGTGTRLPTVRLRGSYQTFTATKTITYSATSYVVPPAETYTIDGSGQLVFGAGDAGCNGVIPVELPPGVTITNAEADVWLDGADLPTVSGVNGLIYYAGNDVTEVVLEPMSATVGGWQTVGGSLSHVVSASTPLFIRQEYADGSNIKLGPASLTYTMPSPDKTI